MNKSTLLALIVENGILTGKRTKYILEYLCSYSE